MTLRAALLAVVPDTPTTVELRGLLLDAATELRGDPSGTVLVSPTYSLIALIGEPPDSLVARAVLDAGDGDGWSVLALRPLTVPGLEWSRATIMTLVDVTMLDRAVAAARDIVAPLTRDELPDLPASHAAEISAALARGTVMRARVDGELACFAYVALRTETHFDLSVDTIEAQRGRGLAQLTAAALINAERRASGRAPVWGALESNSPSIAVARALGFAAVGELFVVEL